VPEFIQRWKNRPKEMILPDDKNPTVRYFALFLTILFLCYRPVFFVFIFMYLIF